MLDVAKGSANELVPLLVLIGLGITSASADVELFGSKAFRSGEVGTMTASIVLLRKIG
jgi:hypothetical protein